MSGDGGGAARSLSDWAGAERVRSPRSTGVGIWLGAGGSAAGWLAGGSVRGGGWGDGSGVADGGVAAHGVDGFAD